jgi:hypothetical protein
MFDGGSPAIVWVVECALSVLISTALLSGPPAGEGLRVTSLFASLVVATTLLRKALGRRRLFLLGSALVLMLAWATAVIPWTDAADAYAAFALPYWLP